MSKSGYKKFLGIVAVLGLGVLGSSKAQASFTTINAPYKGEQSIPQILAHTYGAAGAAAVRIDDNDDQSYTGTVVEIKAIASFASYKQGVALGNEGALFNVTGKGYNVTGEWTGDLHVTNDTLLRTGTGYTMSSLDSANVDGKDHMVTYLIGSEKVGKNLISTYAVGFEDMSKGQHGDFDFNDLVLEVKTATPVVPLPAAAWSGLATLAGSAAVAGARKARRLMA